MKPNNVMVSIGLVVAHCGDVLAAGFKRVVRTRDQQEELQRLYGVTAQAGTPSRDVFRLGRTNAAGIRVADSGTQIFTTVGQKNVCPEQLWDDLRSHGYRLIAAEVFSNKGDETKSKFRLVWTLSSARELSLEGKQPKVVRKYLGNCYYKLFGYNNPQAVSLPSDNPQIQGSIVTLNFSGVNTGPAHTVSDIRDLRMVDDEGHFRCELRHAARHTESVGVNTQCPSRPVVRSGDWSPSGDGTLDELSRAFDQGPKPS